MGGLDKEVFFIAGAVVLVALSGCNREAATLDEIIERNTKAMGGRAAIEAIHSIEVDLHISDPGSEVDGTYYAARPGKMRIDVFVAGKHVFTEAFDGQRGWEWNGKESKTASPLASAALAHGVELPGHLFGLHELRQRGHKVELAGREKIDGVDFYTVRLVLRDGYTTTLYVDPQSWLISRRRDFRPLHVDLDPTPTTIEQRSSDFRRISGVLFAFAGSETDLKTGKVLETSQIKSIKINPPIDPAFFEKL
jgi:outer membrane lipoprotein-sorting protein